VVSAAVRSCAAFMRVCEGRDSSALSGGCEVGVESDSALREPRAEKGVVTVVVVVVVGVSVSGGQLIGACSVE
jgi:hypothetical protein